MSLFGGITYTQSARTVVRSLTWMTFMPVARCSSSGMMPLCVGSRCWTMTNAMPLPGGTRARNCSKASSPPADAPMPTMGNAALASGAAGAAGLRRRVCGIGFFMRLGPALEHDRLCNR
jgi:hypothetical protein